MLTRRLLAALLLLISAAACSKPNKPLPASSPKAGLPNVPSNPLGDLGVVTGVVRLAQGTQLPLYLPEEMEKRVLKHAEGAPLPESCTPPRTTDRQPVQLTADGLLAGVVVAASNFSHQRPRPPRVHEVMIEDCRLKPMLVVAMKGDTLRVRNSVNYPFMPAYGPSPEVRTLIPGQTYDTVLDKPGVSPLVCGFTAPCGRTDVVVMLSPVSAVTDAEGKFRIEAFPAGETVTLSAWHPLFEESRIDVRVEPGAEKKVELVLTPLPAKAATAPASEAQKPSEPAAPKAKTGP